MSETEVHYKDIRTKVNLVGRSILVCRDKKVRKLICSTLVPYIYNTFKSQYETY